MSYTLSQEQYDKLLALTPAVRDELLTSQELDPNFAGVTEAYNAMTKQVEINTALDAFKSGDLSDYTTELGNTGMKFSSTEIAAATIDAKETQAALDDLGDRKVKVSEGFFELNTPWTSKKELTFEELNKQIEVNTGIDIGIHDSKKQYKSAITKVLNQLKTELPENLYKERKDIVWNAYRSVNKQVAAGRGTAPLTEYFDLKQDDTTADSILEGMFKDPEIYQLWLEESK